MSCAIFIWITNSSDHRRVLTANLLHTKYLTHQTARPNRPTSENKSVQLCTPKVKASYLSLYAYSNVFLEGNLTSRQFSRCGPILGSNRPRGNSTGELFSSGTVVRWAIFFRGNFPRLITRTTFVTYFLNYINTRHCLAVNLIPFSVIETQKLLFLIMLLRLCKIFQLVAFKGISC